MAEISADDFQKRVLAAFSTFWADRTPVSYPNRAFDPKDLDAWARIVFLGDVEGETRLSSSVARDHFARAGTITLEAYVRIGLGTQMGYDLTDAFAAWLVHPGVDDILFRAASPPLELGSDGVWYQTAVSARWVYWTDRAA